MPHFSHPLAVVEPGAQIGERTRVWAFAHVLAGARIGEDCNIGDHVFVEGDSTIGDRVTVKNGVQVWSGIHLGNDVFVGPNATFTNDPFPRSRVRYPSFPQTHLEDGCSVGANATILPGLRIGRNAMIGAGAVVTRDVPAHAIVVGNPARIVGYAGGADATSAPLFKAGDAGKPAGAHATAVSGVTWHRFRDIKDLRGDLAVTEYPADVPFLPARHFIVHSVANQEIRGEHAHRQCHQLLICVAGSVHIVADDGRQRQEFILDHPTLGLHLAPMVWGIQYRYSRDAVLLVLASHAYDPQDYIRNYEEFLQLARI